MEKLRRTDEARSRPAYDGFATYETLSRLAPESLALILGDVADDDIVRALQKPYDRTAAKEAWLAALAPERRARIEPRIASEAYEDTRTSTAMCRILNTAEHMHTLRLLTLPAYPTKVQG